MKKQDVYTLVALISLTIITAILSTQFEKAKLISVLVLILSAFKFLLVSFGFMELRKANVAWKVLDVVFLIFFVTIIGIAL